MYRDKLWFKALVVFLLIADTANAIFDTVFVYNALVVHWGESTIIPARLKYIEAAAGDSYYVTRANWGVYFHLYHFDVFLTLSSPKVFATDPAMTVRLFNSFFMTCVTEIDI